MLEIISRFFPRRFKEHISNLIVYSRINIREDTFLGLVVVISFGVSLLISFFLKSLLDVNFFLVFFILFFISLIGFYFTISLKADANAKFVELILPDALHLISSNLRAGLNPDKALLLSARPEFGILSYEINQVGKKLTLGEDIGKALLEMSKKIKSEQLNKTLFLIVAGLRSGGELADLLEQVSKNLRQRIFLAERVRTNILMYFIFIFVAIALGSPLLFGFSSFFIEILEKNLALVEVPKNAILPVSFSGISIPSSFILKFSIISLITTSLFGSLVLGLINKGNEKAGIKYLPILIVSTITVFFLARVIVRFIFGSIFGL